MSDTPQDPDAGTQEGGYGYPTLEQEVTPEVLHAGDAPAGSGDAAHAGTPSDEGEDEDEDDGDGSAPGELVEDPAATEPTD
ncbi:hypothetical protein [Cellulomonas sp.]|uniref:hypothetical protein n=1 Tax=Cellulomonas sp. TaxID=40001 RepID=UPI001B013E92|nr:hypothetical protein [Cellulomonas sp.]MBO9556222.1 hypothetical protein [Cellulomonas sp.]